MNNPDHSTYHDFDDDDPEVGICFNHRIRLSFHLPTKLNYYDLLSHRMFCDLGIVSRIAFTFGCAALSRVQALSKIHYIWRKEDQRERDVNTLKFCLFLSFNNFATVNVDYFSSCEFCHAFFFLFLSGIMFPFICKESIHKNHFMPL